MGLDMRSKKYQYGIEGLMLSKVITDGSKVVAYEVYANGYGIGVSEYNLDKEVWMSKILDYNNTIIVSRFGLEHTLMSTTGNNGMLDIEGRYLVFDYEGKYPRLGTWSKDGKVGNITKLPRFSASTLVSKGMISRSYYRMLLDISNYREKFYDEASMYAQDRRKG